MSKHRGIKFGQVLVLALAVVGTRLMGDSTSLTPASYSAITIIDPPEKSFFTKRLDYEGIAIKAPSIVVDQAIFEARDRLSMMLTNLPSVRIRLRDAGAELHINRTPQVERII